MKRLYWDLETYSTVPITSGSHAYAAQAEVMLFAWAVDDGDVQCWDVTQGGAMPFDLAYAIKHTEEHWCHNAMFDRVVMFYAMHSVTMPMGKARDSMIQAYEHGLPGSLGMLSELYKLGDKAKDKRGAALIQLFCKLNRKGYRNTSETHPEDWATFVEYAKSDIVAMRALTKKMPTVNYPDNIIELNLWHLDQHINMRGVAVDVELARSVVLAVAIAQADLKESCLAQTNGEAAGTQRSKLLDFIKNTYNVDLPDLTKGTVADALKGDIDSGLRELLETRQQASTSSVAKYTKLLSCVSVDYRLRGTLQFSGAARTQRWSGRLMQLQNLPRPTVKNNEILELVDAFKSGHIDLVCDNVMSAASNCLRSVLIAGNGLKLVVSDLSNIEGRVAAWGCNETWKVKAFAEFDKGNGADLYKLAYAKSFNVSVESVTKNQRQIGKCLELSMQYGGGAGAFANFATVYGMDLDAMADDLLKILPVELIDQAKSLHEYFVSTDRALPDISYNAFIACDCLKRLWRAAHPATVAMWATLAQNAVEAVQGFNNDWFDMHKGWLRMALPSGDYIMYPQPKLDAKGGLTYMGMDGYTNKWTRQSTFGGKLLEGYCQKVARNVMAHNMAGIETAGYMIVSSVHDELITEAYDDPHYSAQGLSALLATPPTWATGLPLAAAGFESYRYKKED